MSYSVGSELEYDSFRVRRISPKVVQLYIGKGNICDTGELIAVYYDCAAERAIWFGGDYWWPEGKQVGTTDDPIGLPSRINNLTNYHAGPVEHFVTLISPGFAPDYSLNAILAKAQSLEWFEESGVINSNRMSVDGHVLNLSCGCRLPEK